MQSKLLKAVWAFMLLAALLLACTLTSRIGEQVGEVVRTAEVFATGIEQGGDLLATGRALATQVQGSDLGETAQALGTQVAEGGLGETAQALGTRAAESGLDETAQAFGTQAAESGLLETAQAAITQNASGLIQTLQAVITQEAPGLAGTAQAAATEFASSLGQAPADIPILEDGVEDYAAAEDYVAYTTAADFQTVLSFYRTEMPANEWTFIETSSVETDSSAILNYEKPGRSATVTLSSLPGPGRTQVLITLQTNP